MKTPQRFETAKWEDVPKDIQTHLVTIREHRKGLYIHGGVGTGKTHLLYAIKKGHEEKEVPVATVRVYNCTEMLRQMREDFNKTDKFDHYDLLEDLLSYRGLLMIDDIGSEKLSDWVLETFYLLVNKRYEENIPTIFTSNLKIGELADRIGDRTVSRIVELCKIVSLDGEDKRILKHKTEKRKS